MLASAVTALLSWPYGLGLITNIAASIVCAVVGWFWLLRKIHCSEPHCFRPGRHPVEGTTFRTCQKHTTQEVHERLHKVHAEKFPEQHAHLNSGAANG